MPQIWSPLHFSLSSRQQRLASHSPHLLPSITMTGLGRCINNQQNMMVKSKTLELDCQGSDPAVPITRWITLSKVLNCSVSAYSSLK